MDILLFILLNNVMMPFGRRAYRASGSQIDFGCLRDTVQPEGSGWLFATLWKYFVRMAVKPILKRGIMASLVGGFRSALL